MSLYGTGGPEMEMLESLGNLPVRNFRDGLFPQVKEIHGGIIAKTIRTKMDGCYSCPVRCKKVVQFDEPYPVDGAYGGPEYETLAALGSNCGVGDLKAIAKGNERCNAYSLDTISTGATIGFAMECFEKGFISKADTGGIELRFGDGNAMLECIELIARRTGFGEILAEGTARMARKIGKGSERFAMQVKGLEPGMHDPRLSGNLGLGFMICPQGADHTTVLPEAFFSWENMKAELQPLGIEELPPTGAMGPRNVFLFWLLHLKQIVQDCLVVCIFLRYNLMRQAEILSAVTGWDTNVMELIRIAARVVTLQRLFNIRQGFGIEDDTLPERFFQPKTDGALADKYLDRAKLEKAKKYFYSLMGWDEKGVPLPETVEALYIE
jgi:aldehyde:ferredoxin oxidoreductase